ncbi:MAG: hypothetical protein QOD58_2487 [Mycobacterium sp.]|nr:hypothetical protein [Mycobacterium sp.]
MPDVLQRTIGEVASLRSDRIFARLSMLSVSARKRSSGWLRCAQRHSYRATRPVTGGRSASVAIPGLAATTAGTALVTGSAV